MVDPIVPALREAARHRGYRLLVSKKRTPGAGDYGKFGLADEKGEPILGVSPDGLAASAADVERYLRGGELETWKKSASLTPQSAPAPKKRRADVEDEATPSRTTAQRSRAGPRPAPSPRPPSRVHEADAGTPRAPRNQKPDGAAAKRAHKSAPRPKPAAPALRVRKAKPSDAAAIAKLLAPKNRAKGPAADIAARMVQFAKAGGCLLVAEQGEIVGCLAWTPCPALHRPLSGRIATLLVAERHRRRGVGRALVEEAAHFLAEAGCDSLEAMSDIDIRSIHGFFRKLGFAETSYRFARPLAKTP